MNKLYSFFDSVILFIRYSKLLIKARFQYRLDAFLLPFTVFIREFGGIIVVYLTLKRFNNINGWNMNQMFFLFSFIFLTYSILVFFFTGLRDFSGLVYTGEFDRYLVRPQGLLFQVVASKADYFASMGHGTLGIVLFVSSANSVGIKWNVQNISYCVMSIVGGVLIQASLFLIFSSLSFWIVKTDNLKIVLFYNMSKFAGYPISIYPGFIQKLLIYVIPFAFVNYFPAQFFLRKKDMYQYWAGFLYLTPIIGIILFCSVSILWKIGVRYYTSTGN